MTLEAAAVLVICTANQCRSPMTAALLRDRRPALVVTSAGLLPGGSPAPRLAVRVMAARGLDLSEHVSRRLAPSDLAGADLVVTLERRHLRETVVADHDVLGRAFTLKELVRRGEEIGPRQPGEQLAGWLERVGAGRRPADLVGDDARDDIGDPMGRRASRFEACASQLEDLVDRLAAVAFPVTPVA